MLQWIDLFTLLIIAAAVVSTLWKWGRGQMSGRTAATLVLCAVAVAAAVFLF